MRDDFTQKTKDTLAKRVGNRCSNPQCRKLTSGPSTKKNDSVNIGVAAHICAASEGGMRYAREMISEERKNISNGIWLCGTCAKLIDSDEAQYTISFLNNWKQVSEAKTQREIESGEKLPDDNSMTQSSSQLAREKLLQENEEAFDRLLYETKEIGGRIGVLDYWIWDIKIFTRKPKILESLKLIKHYWRDYGTQLRRFLSEEAQTYKAIKGYYEIALLNENNCPPPDGKGKWVGISQVNTQGLKVEQLFVNIASDLYSYRQIATSKEETSSPTNEIHRT